MKRIVTGATMALILASTAACKREATGQVVAVVNGDEVTLQEVNAEIGGNLPANVDKKAIQAEALKRVVERRLLAQAAKEDEIDKTSDYLVRSSRMNDALLVQLLGEKIAQGVKMPGPAEVSKFMAERPLVFAGRKIYSVDRIRFPQQKDPALVKSLESLHSLNEIAAKLDSMGIRYVRGTSQFDTARTPKEMVEKVVALPAGEPFVTVEPGGVNVGVITGSAAAPLAGPDANPIAVQLMRREALEKALRDRLTAAERAAKIEYQTGFAPKPAAPAKP